MPEPHTRGQPNVIGDMISKRVGVVCKGDACMAEPETYFYSCLQGHRWLATSGLPIEPGADRVRCPQCGGAVTVLRAPAGQENGSAPCVATGAPLEAHR